MKNILILVPSLGIGGREKIAINTYNILKEKYNVFFVVFQRQKTEYEFNDEIFSLNVPAAAGKTKKIFQQIKRAKKLINFCKTNKIDCVFSLGETANITNILTKQFIKIKSVIAIHGFTEVYKNKITDFVFRKSDRIICISKDMEHNLLKLFPNLNNTAVIENGYDISGRLKNRINTNVFSENSPKLVSMGRLEEVKGFDRLLTAFAKITENFPNASLSVIGHGSLEQKLKDLTKKLNIENNVKFLGFMKDPYEELTKNDIYVLTSRNEGFPNCLIEALASGLATVSFDCISGPREILSEVYSSEPITGTVYEKYGILTENNNTDLLAQTIIDLIKDNIKVSYYKTAGPERAMYFSLERYRNKIIDLIEEVVKD